MYQRTGEHKDFMERRGSRSIRPFVRGDTDQPGDPIEILPKLKDQYQTFKRREAEATRRIAEIDQIVKARCAAEGVSYFDLRQERKELVAKRADAIRQKGNLNKLMRDGTRLALEKIFTQVANARLPANTFFKLLEEAREIWRGEGYAEFVPGPTNRERKKRRKAQVRMT